MISIVKPLSFNDTPPRTYSSWLIRVSIWTTASLHWQKYKGLQLFSLILNGIQHKVGTFLSVCGQRTTSGLRRIITLAKMSSYRQKEKHVTCPFIPSHSILPERLYKHIRKCSVQNPDIASKMRVCPFLWTHIIKEEEFEEHVRECPRRDTIRRWFPNLNITD